MPKSYIYSCLIFLLPTLCFATPGDTTAARSFWKEAARTYNLQMFDSAEHYFVQAAPHYLNAKYKMRYADCMDLAGICAYYQRDYKNAFVYFKNAFPIMEKEWGEGDIRMEGLYNNMGGILIELGKRVEGRKYLEKSLALKLAYYGETEATTGITLFNLGLSSLFFGEYKESQSFFLRALPIYQFHYSERSKQVAEIYLNLGITYQEGGEVERSSEYINKSLEILKQEFGPNHWQLAFSYISLGSSCDLLGDLDSAKYYYNKAYRLSQSHHLPKIEANCHSTFAAFYGDDGEYQKALSSINKSIQIIRNEYGDDFPNLANYYRIKAEIYEEMKEKSLMERYYQKAIKLSKKAFGKFHPKMTLLYKKFSESYLELGELDKANSIIHDAIRASVADANYQDFQPNPLPNRAIDLKSYLEVLKVKAEIQFQLGKKHSSDKFYANALQTYERIDEVLDYMRRGYLSEVSKLFLQKNSVPVYEKAIRFCHAQYNRTDSVKYLYKAFQFSEKSKAVLLSESMQGTDIHSLKGIPDEILRFEKDIRFKIRQAEQEFADESQDEEKDISYLTNLKNEIFALKTSNDSLATVISQSYPDYYNLKYQFEVSSPEILQASMADNAAILSYFLGDKNWYIFKITKNDISIETIDQSTFKYEDIEHFREVVSNKKALYATQWELSHQLFQKLIKEPLGPNEAIEKLIIIPDGVLGHLPFDLLLTDKIKDGGFDHRRLPYLLKEYSTSYAYSLTSLLKQQDLRNNTKEKYIGFAPDYPVDFFAINESATRDGDRKIPLGMLGGAIDEVNLANQIFGGKAYIGGDATERNFKNLASGSAIIHLAMHAMVDDEKPLNSKLLFSDQQDSTQDNNLNAYEIYNIKINSQLAVLSACNTGYGKIKRGEGIMSLSRAFLYAGCPSIVTSLWQASDKPTKNIMNSFFNKINQGLSKDEALRQAKLEFLEQADPLLAHPANWATFVVVGDPDPVDFGITWWKWSLLIVAVLLLGFCGWRIVKRKKKLQEFYK